MLIPYKNYLLCFAMFLVSSISVAQHPNFEWAKEVGGIANTYHHKPSHFDNNGNIFSIGVFTNPSDFDPGPATLNITPTGNTVNGYIQKLDANCNLQWVYHIAPDPQTSSPSSISVSSIAFDNTHNVYVVGNFTGTIDFDQGPAVLNLTGNSQGSTFIQKLDPTGNLLWVIPLYGSFGLSGKDIEIDINGNIYVVGKFRTANNAPADFDPGQGIADLYTIGNEDAYFLKLDPNGNFLWVKQTGISQKDSYSASITFDSAGNVYETSYNENNTIIIRKFDPMGIQIWSATFGPTCGLGYDGKNYGQNTTTDLDDNLYVTGRFYGTVDFDPGPGNSNTSAPFGGLFILKLDSQGNFLWVKQLDGLGPHFSFVAITTDTKNNVYTTGNFRSTTDFDPGPGISNLTPNGTDSDVFIQKLNANGDFLWAIPIGSTSFDYSYSILTDTNHNIYTTGYYGNQTDFDPSPGTAYLTSDYPVIQKLSQCQSTYTDIQTACNSYTWLDGVTYTSSNNTATYLIPGGGANGCDSIITLDLTINEVSDITTTVNGATINANNMNATSYQWLNCNSGMSIIQGETASSLTTLVNGDYAVEITENGCIDTSACVTIILSGIADHLISEQIKIYPNPTSSTFTIQFESKQENVSIKLWSIAGQLIEIRTFEQINQAEMILDQPQGIFLVEILNDKGEKQIIRLNKIE